MSNGTSEPIEARIRKMVKNFLDLNSKLCMDDKAMDEFMERPHKRLNDEVGMKIPEDVKIIFDTRESRWATMYIPTEGGKTVAVMEEALGAHKIVYDSNEPTFHDQEITIKPFSKVDVKIQGHLMEGGYRGVLVLPFFDVRVDPMIDIKLDNDSEIILSS